MRSLKLTAMLPLLMALPALAQNAQLEANKMLAQKFFQSFGNPAQLKELMHPDYIQHHPVLKAYAEANHLSGRDAFFKFMESGGFGPPPGAGAGKKKQAGPPPFQIVLTMAAGDLVTVVRKSIEKDPKTGAPYEAFDFDTWHIKDGKLYEHWDGARKQ